jgi:hypothetical protein
MVLTAVAFSRSVSRRHWSLQQVNLIYVQVNGEFREGVEEASAATKRVLSMYKFLECLFHVGACLVPKGACRAVSRRVAPPPRQSLPLLPLLCCMPPLPPVSLCCFIDPTWHGGS